VSSSAKLWSKPNLGLSTLLSEMLRPNKPNKLRQEVKLGLSILLRHEFLLSDLLRLVLAILDVAQCVTVCHDTVQHEKKSV